LSLGLFLAQCFYGFMLNFLVDLFISFGCGVFFRIQDLLAGGSGFCLFFLFLWFGLLFYFLLRYFLAGFLFILHLQNILFWSFQFCGWLFLFHF